MKLTLFGALAAASMSLTSMGVWVASRPDDGTKPAAPRSADWKPPAKTPEDPLPNVGQLLGFGPKSEFSAGKTVVMEGRLGHPKLASGRTAETFLHLDLHAASEAVPTDSPPLDLSIVLDRSKSMEGRRMENAMAAARGMIGRLRTGDTVSVIAYNTTSETLVPPTTIDERTRTDVMLGLRSIEARGNTCISCGVEDAMAVIGRRPGAVKKILLLSDGEANAGIRDAEGFLALAERARGMDTTVSSIGVDVDYNEQLMLAVAQGSNGRHYFVESPSGLPQIFDDELRSLVETVASAAEVELELEPGVEMVEVLDRTFERDGGLVRVPLGTFARGDSKSVLVRLRVNRADAGDRPIASVRLRYRDLVENGEGSCDGDLVAVVTDDPREVSPLDPLVEARLARAETVAALATANAQFSRGDLLSARRTLQDNRSRIRTRATDSSGRVATKDKFRLDSDFERQIGALEKAEESFDEAARAAPVAPATSREGRASVKSNADLFDDFSQ